MKKIDVKGIAIKSVCLGGGSYAAVKLNKIEFIAKQKPALRGALKMGLGAFGPALLGSKMKKGASQITAIGDGILSFGALELASAFDKNLASEISASLAGVGNLSTMGQVVFDESYNSGVGATNDVMGATDEGGYQIEM